MPRDNRNWTKMLVVLLWVIAVFTWGMGIVRWVRVGSANPESKDHKPVDVAIIPVDPKADTASVWTLFTFDHPNEMDNWFYNTGKIREGWDIVDSATGDGAAVFSAITDALCEVALLTLPRDWSDFDSLSVKLENRSHRTFKLVLTAADYYDVDSYHLRHDTPIDTVVFEEGPMRWDVPIAKLEDRLHWVGLRKSIHFEWYCHPGDTVMIDDISLRRYRETGGSPS